MLPAYCLSQTGAAITSLFVILLHLCRQDAALVQLRAQHGGSVGHGSTAAAAAAAPAAGDGSGAELDESLAAHFNTIQELSDRQALEEVLPRLQELLLVVSISSGAHPPHTHTHTLGAQPPFFWGGGVHALML
jgi:hypothetical protein